MTTPMTPEAYAKAIAAATFQGDRARCLDLWEEVATHTSSRNRLYEQVDAKVKTLAAKSAPVELAGIWSDYAVLQRMQYPRWERAAKLVDRASRYLVDHGYVPRSGGLRLESIGKNQYSLVDAAGDRVFAAQGSPLDCARAMMARVPAERKQA